MRQLPVAPAWRLAERDPELRWLVTHLWSQDAVGIVGGEPKCCKSFLALDLAVAVAAGVGIVRSFVYETSVKVDSGSSYRSRPKHLRHGQILCLVAASGQAPRPRSGVPKARGLTARLRTKP